MESEFQVPRMSSTPHQKPHHQQVWIKKLQYLHSLLSLSGIVNVKPLTELKEKLYSFISIWLFVRLIDVRGYWSRIRNGFTSTLFTLIDTNSVFTSYPLPFGTFRGFISAQIILFYFSLSILSLNFLFLLLVHVCLWM